ncbi:unnamed protein product, partial [Gulo gulo]
CTYAVILQRRHSPALPHATTSAPVYFPSTEVLLFPGFLSFF